MKRKIATMLLLAATIMSYATAGNDNVLSKRRARNITTFFTQTLLGEEAAYTKNSRIDIDEIQRARQEVWNCWRNASNSLDEAKLIEPFTNEEPRDTGYWTLPPELEENAIMPYYFIKKGEAPENGYPLFLYMHGSGDKVREWETGYALCNSYDDAPSLHFIPQIPNAYGELYRWAIQSKQWAWEKLLRLAFLDERIDANRIYFYGISEGGYGSQRLASFYADYLAGAGPMAGGEPLKNAPMENLANIAFSLRTGEQDHGFARNYMTYNAGITIDSLRNCHPGLYNYFIEIVPGRGHAIDYDKSTPWLKQFTRNAHPTYFYWENYDMYGRKRIGFYNIRVNEDSNNSEEERSCYEVNISGNTIEVEVKNVKYTTTHSIYNIPMLFTKEYSPATKGNITIFINEELFDLSKPIQVIVNGKEKFNGRVRPNLRAMVESCAEYFDPERIFPASIDVEID